MALSALMARVVVVLWAELGDVGSGRFISRFRTAMQR